MIKAIIIEDNAKSSAMLHSLLTGHFKNIEVAAICANNSDAKTAIEKIEPDLVISDIELGKESVFTMLQELDSINFEIIFTTGYDKYALQAIKFSALDYILKPFGKEELAEAIFNYEQKQHKKHSSQQFETLFYNFKQIQKDLKKIALPTTKGLEVYLVKEVVRCESESNYTNFFFTTRNSIIVSKTLKDYEELLQDYNFFRVHHSHLVNLDHVKKFVRKDDTVVMSDGSVVEVSRRKKEAFLEKLEAL